MKQISKYMKEVRDDYYVTNKGSVYRKKYDSDFIIKIYNLRQEGLSYEKIGKIVGLSTGGVYGILNKHPLDVIYNKLHGKRDKDGYIEYQLRDYKSDRLYRRGHRLVVYCYLENSLNKPLVNHIDGVKNNNKLENLEWVTASENNLHAYHVLHVDYKKNLPDNSIRIKCKFNNNKVVIYDSVTQCCKDNKELNYEILLKKIKDKNSIVYKNIEFTKLN